MTGGASDFLDWFIKENDLQLAPFTTKIVFPQAPEQKNDWYGEEETTSWFNEFDGKNKKQYNVTYDKATWKVNQTDLEGRKKVISDVTLLRAATDNILELIKIEIKALPEKHRSASRIWLGGVGQGSMMALSTFLRYVGEDRLGGVVGLLGYVPLPVSMMENSVNSTL